MSGKEDSTEIVTSGVLEFWRIGVLKNMKLPSFNIKSRMGIIDIKFVPYSIVTFLKPNLRTRIRRVIVKAPIVKKKAPMFR